MGKFLIRSQILAIIFSVFWIIYLNILAFFDQPDRAMQYINWFVYGFAALFGIIGMFLTKYLVPAGRSVFPLVILPELLIYQPILLWIFSSIISSGYASIIRFLSISTGITYLIAISLGLILGLIIKKR